MNLSRVWDLIKKSVYSWIDDYAPSMGAALAYYTLFSIAPVLIIVIAVAGFVFGQEAAQGEITAQLQGLMGKEGAVAVEGLLESASQPTQGIVATLISIIVLVIGATTVFAELQSDLDRIWRAPAAEQPSGIWALIRARLLSLGMVLAIGFLLLVSLVASAALAALGKWWGGIFGGWEVVAHVFNFLVSFAVITGAFAMMYKILPRVNISWHDVWIGAAVTALLFTIGKFLIGFYLGKSGVASGFGAAGSFVVLLVWVYYSAQIFLLGAEFTWVYAHEYGSLKGQAKPAEAQAVPSRTATPQAAGAAPSPERPPLVPGVPADVQTSAPAAMPAAIHHLNAVHHLNTPYPTTSRAPAATDLTGKTSAFFRDNPVKGLGIVASVGLLIGGLLREAAPPAKLLRLPRRIKRRAVTAHPAPARTIAPAKPALPRVPAKPSVLQRLSRKWKIQAGRSLLRELTVAAIARLLATRVVRKRVATRKDTLIKRLALSLAENWVDRNRRLSH